MAASQKIYSRLTRAPLAVGVYKSLWLAADHFMQVESSGYNESYQRFQFTDVQGFFITSSNRRLYWNLFWSLIGIVAVIPFGFALSEEEVPGASMVFLTIAVIFLLWNNLLGPSCRVFLVTKVQTVHLGGVARLRKAKKALGRIQPLIEEAQKSLVVPVATKATVSSAASESDVIAQAVAPVLSVPAADAPAAPQAEP